MVSKVVIVCVCLIISCFPTFAQISIIGTVNDNSGKPIPNASVTLNKVEQGIVVAFSIANKNGGYHIKSTSTLSLDSFYLNVSCLGYSPQRYYLSSRNDEINCYLNVLSISLPKIIIKNSRPRLKARGDTLNYVVDSFKNVHDRTIGDVLKKMPGIDVDATGKISYNGKAISNFYIDGDNLLDDKYNLATKSISADMVDKVQILENHQPIKVLRDVSVSERVSLNLSLKDEAHLKINSHAELGLGSSIYDETLNVMGFKKNFKAINSIKSNNNGVDVQDEIISHNLSDYFKQIDNEVPNNLLSLSASGAPNLSKERYLFNNAALLNTNNLLKLNNGVQIKANIYYLYDKQQQTFNNIISYYLPTDTVNYEEKQNVINNFNNLRVQLNINLNKTSFYLNHTLLAETNNTPSSSSLLNNGTIKSQSLLEKYKNYSSEFDLITTQGGKNVIEYYSYFNYLNRSESLQIQPGINDNIFNNNIAYKQITQDVTVPTFFTNNYINYRHPYNNILQSYKVGIIGQWQQLPSNIYVTQLNNQISNLSDSAVNHLDWRQYKLYSQIDYDYIGERSQVGLSLQATYRNISYSDSITKKNENLTRLNFNPTLRFKYQTGIENYISIRYGFNSSVATIENVFSGYILKNYHLLSNNSTLFQESFTHNLSAGFNFRKAIKILFANISVSYSFNSKDYLLENSYYNTIQKVSTIAYNNNINTLSISGGISKYIFVIHSTMSLHSSYQINSLNQIQNSLYSSLNNYSTAFSCGINTKFSNLLNSLYMVTYSLGTSKNIDSKSIIAETNFLQQNLEVNINPSPDFNIKLLQNYSLLKQSGSDLKHYYFSDVSATYKINKWKTDVSLYLNNINNVQEYVSSSISGNSFSRNSYIIRPRSVLLRIFFNF